MAGNHLEQLVAEWYEYRGYFVRRNVLVGKRAKGGYECELDVVAFNPETRHLVHIEPSMDADTWERREKRFRTKFAAGRKHIPKLFTGLDIPDQVEQLAVLCFASTKNHTMVGGGKIMLLRDLVVEVLDELKSHRVASHMVPEQFPLLRTLQFVCEYRDAAIGILKGV